MYKNLYLKKYIKNHKIIFFIKIKEKKNIRVTKKNLNGQCSKERKKEKRRYKPLKEEIGGESTIK